MQPGPGHVSGGVRSLQCPWNDCRRMLSLNTPPNRVAVSTRTFSTTKYVHGRARATTAASAVGATRCISRRGVHPQAASPHHAAALRCAGVRVDVAALPRGRVDEMLQEPSRPANISKIVSAAARAARGGCQASVGVCWRPEAAAQRHRGGCRSRPRRSYFSINWYAAASTRPRTPARCERFHPPAPCPWSAG